MESDEDGRKEMNQLSEFFITFTTNGLTELKDGLKDINTKLDSLNTSFDKGVSKGDSFFSKFTNWGLKLTALAAGFVSVGKAIKDAFNMGTDIISLNTAADAAGVKAEQVEALAIATAPYLGGRKDISSAGNFFQNLAMTQTKAWRGQYAQSLIDEMAYAGGITISPESTKEQWMYGIADLLHYYTLNPQDERSAGARLLLSQAFGGMSREQMLLLSEGSASLRETLGKANQHLTMPGEENLIKALEQTKAKMKFQEEWENLVTELIPLTTKIYNALTAVVKSINDFFQSEGWKAIVNTAKWLYETFKEGWEMISGWFRSKYGENEPTVENAVWQMTEHKGRVALNNILNDNASIADIAYLQQRLTDANAMNPELKKAFGNEMNRLMMLNAMSAGQTLDLPYDKNLKLADVILSQANSNLSSRSGGVNNDVDVNIREINITGMGTDAAKQTANALNGEIQTAVLSGGIK